MEAAKRLRDAGLKQEYAEAIAGMEREAAQADREELATKGDMLAVRSDLKADLAALEARLTWRMVGLAAFIVAAVKLIPAP